MEYVYQIALSYATENEDIVEAVYHYLHAEGISVFWASTPEGQRVLSGKNQQEIFYEIFGVKSEYVALFVSKDYVRKFVPMQEARIAIAKHGENGSVIPIYLDGTALPEELFDARKTNYYKSSNSAEIASHLAGKIKKNERKIAERTGATEIQDSKKIMKINNNIAEKQIFIHTYNGSIEL